MVFFRGAHFACGGIDSADRVTSLKQEIENLHRMEKELDQHKNWVQQSIKNVTDDASTHRYVLICAFCRVC